MRLGVLSTSWPSVLRPWAGHFVADLGEALARSGVEVCAVVPWFGAGGALEARPGVTLAAAPVAGPPRSPAGDAALGVTMLRALRERAARESVDLWLCHWWPTGWAVPRGARRLMVLHGSDVDLLERLPRAVGRRLAPAEETVAVAETLAWRHADRLGGARPTVCRLGARSAADEGEAPPPAFAQGWLDASGPRVLTVGRAAPGKGLAVARAAARRLDGVAWLTVTPALGAGPRQIEQLIRSADLVVVPSEGGPGLPSEGSPHVITQALVAGVPVLGGPNAAVRAAVRTAGQAEVCDAGPDALAEAVSSALEPSRRAALAEAARRAGAGLDWGAVLPAWLRAIEGARSAPAGLAGLSGGGWPSSLPRPPASHDPSSSAAASADASSASRRPSPWSVAPFEGRGPRSPLAAARVGRGVCGGSPDACKPFATGDVARRPSVEAVHREVVVGHVGAPVVEPEVVAGDR